MLKITFTFRAQSRWKLQMENQAGAWWKFFHRTVCKNCQRKTCVLFMERCASGKHTRDTTSQWNVWFLLQTWQHKYATQPRLKPSLRCYISFLTLGQWTSTPNNPLFLRLTVAPSFHLSFPQREKGPRQQINASFSLCGGVLAEVVIMVRGRWVGVFNSVEGSHACRCALHHPQWRIKQKLTTNLWI